MTNLVAKDIVYADGIGIILISLGSKFPTVKEALT